MEGQHRLKSEEQQELAQRQAQQAAPLEFNSPEEMLQHDRRATPVPPDIARKLKDSVQAEKPQPVSWWKRLLGG